jgi:DNA primase
LALPLITQIPGETLRIYMRQALGNKLGILDDSQLEKLMPKQAPGGSAPVAPPLKRTTMRVLVALLIQNPQLATLVPSLDGLAESKIAGLPLFIELVTRCNENPGLTTGQLLELYRGTNFSQTLETLAVWNHMIVDEESEAVFQDSLASVYDSALEERLEFLIARERTHGLSTDERRELWALSQAFAKK